MLSECCNYDTKHTAGPGLHMHNGMHARQGQGQQGVPRAPEAHLQAIQAVEPVLKGE